MLLIKQDRLTVGESVCVCVCVCVGIRQVLKARDQGEPYQLRWLKNKTVCLPVAPLTLKSWGDVC